MCYNIFKHNNDFVYKKSKLVLDKLLIGSSYHGNTYKNNNVNLGFDVDRIQCANTIYSPLYVH